jgi:hypothetical protein
MNSDTEKTDEASPSPKVEGGVDSCNDSAIPADASTLTILNLIKEQDAFHPIHWPAWKRWLIVVFYCFLQLFVTMTSTSYIGIEFNIQEKWGGSTQVVTLGQSLFILGTAIGPAFMGPLS